VQAIVNSCYKDSYRIYQQIIRTRCCRTKQRSKTLHIILFAKADPRFHF